MTAHTPPESRAPAMSSRKKPVALFFTFIRYNLVGLLNTALGYGLIFGLMYFFNVSANWSNFIGYAVGAVISYYLNRSFTFRRTGGSIRQPLLFFGAIAVSYLVNWLVLNAMLHAAGHDRGWQYVCQFVAGIVYIIVSFVLLKTWVFREPALSEQE